LTDGQYPYTLDLSNQEVAKKVVNENLRLPKPENCPNELWQIVTSCWDLPDKRPTFKQLFQSLNKFSSTVAPSESISIKDLVPKLHEAILLDFVSDYFSYHDPICKAIVESETDRFEMVKKTLAPGAISQISRNGKIKAAMVDKKINAICMYISADHKLQFSAEAILSIFKANPYYVLKWVALQNEASEVFHAVVKDRHAIRIIQPYPGTWGEEYGTALIQSIIQECPPGVLIYIGVYKPKHKETLLKLGFSCAKETLLRPEITLWSMLKGERKQAESMPVESNTSSLVYPYHKQTVEKKSQSFRSYLTTGLADINPSKDFSNSEGKDTEERKTPPGRPIPYFNEENVKEEKKSEKKQRPEEDRYCYDEE